MFWMAIRHLLSVYVIKNSHGGVNFPNTSKNKNISHRLYQQRIETIKQTASVTESSSQVKSIWSAPLYIIPWPNGQNMWVYNYGI